MHLPEHIKEKLSRLYGDHFLGTEEISTLEKWLKQAELDPQMNQWLSHNWDLAENVEFNSSFDEIRQRIKQYRERSKTDRIRRMAHLAQKVAAILALPLLAVSIWLLVNRHPAPSNMTLVTAKGERTHVWLPDSSQVWLNVDSKLEYSTDYNVDNRLLKLKGEAFFKVAKGKKFPFIVKASHFQVKAVGTEFNISAYNNESNASAYLKEGIVEVSYFPKGKKVQKLRMTPGEQVTVNLTGQSINLSREPASNAIRWTNGELFFDDEPMDEVFRKAGRWYDVKIDYKPGDFAGETLTVNLENGEPVDHLFQIIDKVMGISITKKGKEYVIRRK